MKIKDLAIGQMARVIGYAKSDRAYVQKLLGLGVVKGAVFRMVRAAPLGDPIEIRVRGRSLTLRKAEAETIDIEAVRT